MKIGIIDYGAGNLRSVHNAFLFIGSDVSVAEDPDSLASFDGIVLPGVGSSRDAMRALSRSGMDEAVLDQIKKGKPFLGICLGLQLLFTESLEHGRITCLGLLEGTVRPFRRGEGLKVPQIGWNNLLISNRECPLFKDISDGEYFYFVHSYYCDTRCPEYTAGMTSYGNDYVSAVWKDNVYAVQFHPERSQEKGIQILRNFSEI